MDKEYIEREKVREAYIKSFNNNTHRIKGASAIHIQEHQHILHILDKMPIADVVEVVRCEKCTHKVDFRGRVMCNRNAHRVCDEWYGLTATDNDHFCSYGIRKED